MLSTSSGPSQVLHARDGRCRGSERGEFSGAQVHSVKTVVCRTNRETVLFNGLASSLRVDFPIRAVGVGHVDVRLTARQPCELPELWAPLVIARVLRLNCLTTHCAALREELAPTTWEDDGFAKRDARLGPWVRRSAWARDVALRQVYARQASVELDALAALALSVSMRDLALVCRVQFPVLQEYERGTWCDAEGRVAFTVNKGMPGVGLARAGWERVKDAAAGDVVTGGYVAPFDRCERAADMRADYETFKERAGVVR